MRKLTEYKSAGMIYHCLKREGDVAIFKATKPGRSPMFEVIVIQHSQEHTWPNGSVSKAWEYPPSLELWGIAGWTPLDLDAAEAKFAKVLKSRVEMRDRKALRTCDTTPVKRS